MLLRFLRARKWNVTNGLTMILKAFKWRLEDDIEEVKSKSEDELDAKYRGFRLQMEMGKSFVHGTDKLGRPVVYVSYFFTVVCSRILSLLLPLPLGQKE